MKKTICLLGLIFMGCGPTPVPLVLSHYITAQEALANDNLEVAQAALIQLSRSAEEPIGSLAKNTASLSTIENIRDALRNYLMS